MQNRFSILAISVGIAALGLSGVYLAFELGSPGHFHQAEAAENEPSHGTHDAHMEEDDHAHEQAGHGEAHSQESHDHSAEENHGHEKEALPELRLSEEEREALGIVLREASPGHIASEIELPAEIQLNEDRVAHVVPRVSGIVREVYKTVGDKVSEGELMAVLESRELADAQAEYLAATTRLQLARKEYAREKSLWQEEISAEKDYLAASRELEEAQILAQAAAQKLKALGVSAEQLQKVAIGQRDNLTRYEMTAPFAGEVLDKHIVLGEALASQSNAFVIADLDSVWVNVRVYQKDLLRVHEGQAVQVSGPEGYSTVQGTITYVAPVVDRETRTALARIVLPNKDRQWRPGLFLHVRLRLEETPASVVISKRAVQRFDSGTVVFVEKDGLLQAVELELGRETEESVEVLSGLSPGDRYVAEGAFELKAKVVTSNLGAHAGHGH